MDVSSVWTSAQVNVVKVTNRCEAMSRDIDENNEAHGQCDDVVTKVVVIGSVDDKTTKK